MKYPTTILFLFIVFILASCSKEQYVEVKNDEGVLIEKYQINKDSTKNGLYESFTSEGKLFERSTFINGIQDGMRTIYYPSGAKEIEETYQNGLINGDYKVYYESGALKLMSTYVNGTVKGKVKKYYESGQLMEDVTFEENEENGPFKEYWENGNLKWEGTFRNGDNEYGELLKYNEEGTLIRKLMCDSLAVCRTFWTIKENTDNEG